MKIQLNNLNQKQVIALVSLGWVVIFIILFFIFKKKDSSFDDMQDLQREISIMYEQKIDSLQASHDKEIARLDTELAKVSSDNKRLYEDYLTKKDSFERRIYWLNKRTKHEDINYNDSTLNGLVRELSD